MRKRVFLGLLLLGATAVIIFVSQAGQSGTGIIFGPDFFIRGEGKPFIEVREFSSAGYQAPFLLHLRNGDEEGNDRVSSARVWLNDMLLFGPNNFSQKVPGYDIPVELKEQNVLKVELASAPGSKLKIWIEGIPTTVIPEFVFDEQNCVSAFITNEGGGRIETWGANDVNYVLEIPPSSLLELEGKTITLTPIISVAGLPSNSLFVVGVRLMPDGLQFFRSAKLTIKLPALTSAEDVWGVCYNGSLGEHYTHPFMTVDQATSTISFELRHFSDWVVFINSNCPSANPQYQQDIYKSALACILRSSVPDEGQISTLFTDWYDELVMPELYQATDLKSLKGAHYLFLEWLATLQMLGREGAYESQIGQAEAQVGLTIKNEFLRMNTECTQTTNWCVKENLFKEYLMWLAEAQRLFDEAFLEGLVQPEDFCDYINSAIGKIDISATSDQIPPGQTLAFTAVVTGMKTPPQQIKNAFLTWSSSNTSIAFVEETFFDLEGVAHARIRAVAPGQVEITAKANEACNTTTSKTILVSPIIEVQSYPNNCYTASSEIELVGYVNDGPSNIVNSITIKNGLREASTDLGTTGEFRVMLEMDECENHLVFELYGTDSDGNKISINQHNYVNVDYRIIRIDIRPEEWMACYDWDSSEDPPNDPAPGCDEEYWTFSGGTREGIVYESRDESGEIVGTYELIGPEWSLSPEAYHLEISSHPDGKLEIDEYLSMSFVYSLLLIGSYHYVEYDYDLDGNIIGRTPFSVQCYAKRKTC